MLNSTPPRFNLCEEKGRFSAGNERRTERTAMLNAQPWPEMATCATVQTGESTQPKSISLFPVLYTISDIQRRVYMVKTKFSMCRWRCCRLEDLANICSGDDAVLFINYSSCQKFWLTDELKRFASGLFRSDFVLCRYSIFINFRNIWLLDVCGRIRCFQCGG